MANMSILLTMANPIVDTKKHVDQDCTCIWFSIRIATDTQIDMAFNSKADMEAFVHLLMIACGMEQVP